MSERNWAGNHEYRTDAIRRPRSLDQLADLVAAAPGVRALGTRHSFSHIADAELLVDLAELPGQATLAADRSSVTVPGHWTYSQLAPVLHADGCALQNLASLPHISIAGAVSTGTHGSGDRNGNLATEVIGIDLLTASGEVVSLDRTDDRFNGALVSMGTLGIVTSLTLSVEPTYEVRQDVFEPIDLATIGEAFDEIFGAAHSVSAFTRWDGDGGQIWVKRRVDRVEPLGGVFDGMRPSEVEHHPIPASDASACTPQLGAPGPWHERLPHFRADAVPSAGDEIQSEFFVPREEAEQAVIELRAIGAELSDVLLVSEVRTIAADDLWMSPHHESDSVGFHFTFRRDPVAVADAVRLVEAALSAFAPRPHWGKVFTFESFDADELYRCFDDFTGLRRDLDPTSKFANRWTRKVLGT